MKARSRCSNLHSFNPNSCIALHAGALTLLDGVGVGAGEREHAAENITSITPELLKARTLH